MPVAEDVPVVKDQPYFVCAEAARLAAMQEAQDAATPEARLEATLLVTHLFQQQIDEMADVMSAVRELSPDAPERQVALDWVGAWTADGKEKFPQWAQYQNSLVAVVGRDRAQEIADGAAAARAQAVIDGAKARIAARVAEIEAGLNALEAEAAPPPAGMKTCPDCAEEVRAAARKCRFCGYRFDAAEPAAG